MCKANRHTQSFFGSKQFYLSGLTSQEVLHKIIGLARAMRIPAAFFAHS